MDNRPHSRDKRVSSGTAGVSKGRRVSPGGGEDGGRSYGGRGGGSGKVAAGLGLLGLFALLPKKLRRVLLIVAAVVIVFSLLRSSMGGGTDTGGQDTMSLYDDLFGGTDGGTGTGSSYSGTDGGGTGSGSTGSGSSPFDSLYGNSYGPAAASPAPAQSQGADATVSVLARDKRFTPVGDGRDTVTVMVYMCGTDLESRSGMGTKDLSEMAKAYISDKVNLIVETGGCKSWQNNIMSSSVNQIYRIKDGGFETLEKNFGSASMTDPGNLSQFIRYCSDNFPANRNILILWDHGGGSISGYGYDEKKSASGSMTLTKLSTALADADCMFDWIGFDACLMATLENAMVCNSYADYLVASEEVEPGTGWYYTDWLTELSHNTSIPTLELTRGLVDDYLTVCGKSSYSPQVTLSVVDLAELSGTVPEPFREFSVSTNELIGGEDYQQVSDARAGVRQFSQSSKINQVDLVDLARRIGTQEGEALAQAIQDCVKYNGSTISRSYGLSIYFPYESMNSVSGAVAAYKSLGLESEYTKCIQSFASLEFGGQISSSASSSSGYGSYSELLEGLLGSYSGSSSPLDSLFSGSYGSSYGSSYYSSGSGLSASDIAGLLSAFGGRSMPQEYSWVDTELVAASADKLAVKRIDPARICPTEKDGRRVLSLTDQEWALIQTVELNVFADDGAGFIDLGLDNVFSFDGADLLLDFDGTWLTADGQAVAYYLVTDRQNDDGSWTTTGRIPAILNGQYVNLRVVFDGENPYGAITGAYPLYAQGETDTAAKGEIALSQGDELEFLCQYYGYDGSFDAYYTLGTGLTVGAASPELSNMRLDAEGLRFTYRLTDIYGNHYWVQG